MRTRASRTFVGVVAVALCASTVFVLEPPAPASATGFGAGDIVVVRVGIKVILPTAGTRFPGRSIIPIAFQFVDTNGKPISDISALHLVAAQRVTISASGAQSLAASRPVYDPIFTHAALYAWKTAQRPTGAATISISITSPQAPTQVVTIPIVLT